MLVHGYATSPSPLHRNGTTPKCTRKHIESNSISKNSIIEIDFKHWIYVRNVNGKRHVNVYCILDVNMDNIEQVAIYIFLYWTKRWINYNEETIVMYLGIIMSNSHAHANVFSSTCQMGYCIRYISQWWIS